MRLVILEGPDGSGKSTLAQEFVSKGFHYLHCGVPKPGENVFETYTNLILRAFRSKKDTVIDRLHLGEKIYGEVMRGEDTLGYMGAMLIERLIRSQRGQIVICLPPITNCIDNWAEKRKDRWNPEEHTGDYVDAESKIIRIWEMYQELYHNNGVGYHRYSYLSKESRDVVMDYCLNWCGDHGAGTAENPFRQLPPGVIGNPSANTLIVGEQVNLNKTKRDLPFYDLSGSSRYLFQALRDAGFRESELAFVNAVTPKGKVTDQHRHRRKSDHHRNLKVVAGYLPLFKRAIALGKTAARVCRESNIPYYAVPHPAWWGRFKHHSMAEYSLLLKGALHHAYSSR